MENEVRNVCLVYAPRFCSSCDLIRAFFCGIRWWQGGEAGYCNEKGGAVLDQWLPDQIKANYHVLEQVKLSR